MFLGYISGCSGSENENKMRAQGHSAKLYLEMERPLEEDSILGHLGLGSIDIKLAPLSEG
jgi:hypothetical protein